MDPNLKRWGRRSAQFRQGVGNLHSAMRQNHHRIADRLNIGKDVRAKQHGLSVIARQQSNAIEHHLTLFGIQTGRRFVQDQHGRIMDDRLCKSKFLAHSRRIRFDVAVSLCANPQKSRISCARRSPSIGGKFES